MKALKTLTPVALLLIVSLTACKKNKDVVKKQDCRIITVTATPSSVGDPYNISYNEDGKVSSTSIGDVITTFAYSGNTVIAISKSAGVFQSKKIITVNSNGMATNVRTENDENGTSFSNEVYEYSGTELVKSTSTSSSGGTPTVTILVWSNGNFISATSGTNVTTVDYSTDKLAQAGDYLDLVQLLAGYRIYKPKNRIKSILSGTSISSFSYGVDAADGKITSLTISGATSATYNYQHQCN